MGIELDVTPVSGRWEGDRQMNPCGQGLQDVIVGVGVLPECSVVAVQAEIGIVSHHCEAIAGTHADQPARRGSACPIYPSLNGLCGSSSWQIRRRGL